MKTQEYKENFNNNVNAFCNTEKIIANFENTIENEKSSDVAQLENREFAKMVI